MPVWQITHHENAFTDADKQAIAQEITSLYETIIPRFYVNVFFHPLPKSSFFIGGEQTDDFVRFQVDHIARSIKDDVEERRRFLAHIDTVLKPFIQDRGLRWELNIDDTPFELWTINGLIPPPPNSPMEAKWRQENRASAYEAADA